MNPLDFINITSIATVLLVVGAIGVILLRKPLDKLIMLSLTDAGLFLAMVAFQYLDIALLVALLSPLSIVVFLLSLIKVNELRQKNLEESENV
jgi:energy-converting hydrogenase A subunit D